MSSIVTYSFAYFQLVIEIFNVKTYTVCLAWEVIYMCYNCGCNLAEDDMGRGDLSKGGSSLTEEDFKKMAEDWGMDIQEAKENVYKLLKSQLDK